ncbi:MAG TPA: homocysteine S-methyltransferase family protein [Actinomycetota bacterium]|jgi:betaine-homocysteine S-methyltransferase|nr:homocysteine S-methyltransferase family protein [Actinomycetota bacterium]
MTKGILERLTEGPVLGDGGYLLELEKRGYVQAGPFTPEVVIEHPDALAELHREFLRAGVDVLQTMTFYASDDKLATVGMKDKVDEINRNAVQIARKVASEGDALVAGNLSLTWAYLPEDPSSVDHVRALFDRQLQDQLDAGPPDFWIGETFSYLGEALLFVERAKATGLPTMVTMSFEQVEPRSYEGDTPAECARRLAGAGADVVGVNCLNGPEQQLPIAIEMRGAVDGYIATQPVAYRTTAEEPDFTASPRFPYALDPLQLSRQEMADYARKAKDAGIDYIGSCCGSVQAHARAMAKAIGKLPSDERDWKSETGRAMSAYEYRGHTETET